MIRRLFLCAAAAALLTLSATAFGQGKTVKVYVLPGENQASKDVASTVSGKIGSTLRYALTTDLVSAEITVEILCLTSTERGVAYGIFGVYYPVGYKHLSRTLITDIVTGSNEFVAQALFNDFVRESSDEELSEAEDSLKSKTLNTGWRVIRLAMTKAKPNSANLQNLLRRKTNC
jgi:hypothetical protein